MRVLFFILFICAGTKLSAQQNSNLTLKANWDDNTLPIKSDLSYNDCWGFAKAGREYAVLGSLEKIHFIEVTNPLTINEVQRFTLGANSIWRDFKFYKDHIYAVCDESSPLGEGLNVFDVSNINATSSRVTHVFQNTSLFTRVHNIWIDSTAGRLYCAGSSNGTGRHGLVVYDIKTTPASPTVCANLDLRPYGGGYVHDVHVQNGKIYCSHGTTIGMKIYDATAINAWQPGNALITTATNLGGIAVPNQGYNHSSYLSEDKTKLIMAEETHGKPLRIVDVSDASSLTVVGTMYSCTECSSNSSSAPNGSMPIVHNPFVKGNLAFLAYYHEGVVVYDISTPSAPTRVAYYDTDYPNRSTSYQSFYGAWGAYPYLPSQRVLVSDVLNGLFVLELNQTLLPVTWNSFRAWRDNNVIRVRWSTAQERNSANYDVERSADGLNFTAIARVRAAGNSNMTQDYSYTDEKPESKNNYYRIKQIDADGKWQYTDIKQVGFSTTIREPQLYPNPSKAEDKLTLAFSNNNVDGEVDIKMYDLQGRLIHENKIAFAKEINIEKPTSEGIYILHITVDGVNFTKKVVVK